MRRLRSIGMADAPPPVPVFGRAIHTSIGGSAHQSLHTPANGIGSARLRVPISNPPSISISRLLCVAASRVTTSMRGKKRRVWVAWDDVVCGPRVVGPCAFETDPAILCGVANRFGSSLVVACVVRLIWLGMKSVICGLTVWASARTRGEIAASQARSLDCHNYPNSSNCSLTARLPLRLLHIR